MKFYMGVSLCVRKLREEGKLKVFENGLLRRIFGKKGD
jgi:hypothetical protein